ncbi:DUF4325 domain-containing protein [Mediterraneibacter glycyrrhizinilyticus]|uniref:STAS-like domain-containing protein n=1 Tax=Mediterraneibacter glycyrrhizinilyticus TaxID=342942 RepID=UPI00265A981A|nr:DUF4325 domain-containing protein [Mediterraneibacter glycyrrhizinilyticus]MCF2568281.1 DUF4325 domain-containing protein [Mediterraneibacter glycyrrhizinilyticus]
MSFTEAKRRAIQKYMLNKVRCDDADFIKKTAENFEISETSVRRYIKDCLDKGIVAGEAERKTGLLLTTVSEQWNMVNAGMLEEDELYWTHISPFLGELSGNVQDIWYYAFTEIMNNAIDHSGGDQIRFGIQKDALYTEISITDNGVGIFRNIQDYFRKKSGISLNSEQAAMELYKGRMTTDPARHSGEGIFFVSKMLSEFAVWSDNTVYSYRCDDRDRFVQSHLISYYTKMEGIGTMAVMKLENNSKRTSREVFDTFAPLEEGFVKTLIPMKEMCPLGDPVARSQARRILRRLDEFREIIFDFRDIDFMGQGFADEVFRVFQNQHPDIMLNVINANETVLGMIRHVKRG